MSVVSSDPQQYPDEADPAATIMTTSLTSAVVVAVVGDVDAPDAAALTSAVEAACRSSRLVVVDLDGVTFFGSRGLSALLAAQVIARRHGATVAVVAAPAQRIVRRALAVTGLHASITIHDDMVTALTVLLSVDHGAD